jgi:uncharacterized protein YdgA (DUF945 family)
LYLESDVLFVVHLDSGGLVRARRMESTLAQSTLLVQLNLSHNL